MNLTGKLVVDSRTQRQAAYTRTSSLERAARAFALTASGVDEWDALDAGTRDRLMEAVRAALMALREPSASAIRAGARKSNRNYRSSAIRVEAIWQAMIDLTAQDR